MEEKNCKCMDKRVTNETKEILNEYDVLEDFEIRSGTCLGGSTNIAYGLKGERKVCLQETEGRTKCYFDK